MEKIKRISEKHSEIIAAAKDLFNRTHDVKRVSLESIARKANVSPTTIYNYFGDRDTLVFEVIKELTSRNMERNRAIVRSDLPFAQKLMAIVSGKMDIAETINGEILQKFLSQDNKIAPFIDELYQQEIKPLWKEFIADGQRQGYIDPAINDETVIIYLDIIQAGLKARSELFKNINENMSLIEQLTRLIFFGFLKKDIDLFPKEAKPEND